MNLPSPLRWLTEFRMKYLPSLKIRTNYSRNEHQCHQCQKKTETKSHNASMAVCLERERSSNDNIIKLASEMTSITYCKKCCDKGDETKTKWIIYLPLPQIFITNWVIKIISTIFLSTRRVGLSDQHFYRLLRHLSLSLSSHRTHRILSSSLSPFL